MQPKYRQEPKPGLATYTDVILAERFGGWPWELDDVPWTDYLRLIKLLSLEGELQAHIEKLPTDQDVIWE